MPLVCAESADCYRRALTCASCTIPQQQSRFCSAVMSAKSSAAQTDPCQPSEKYKHAVMYQCLGNAGIYKKSLIS
eukprot:2710192-Pleurochrysis_carterae.AAC.1